MVKMNKGRMRGRRSANGIRAFCGVHAPPHCPIALPLILLEEHIQNRTANQKHKHKQVFFREPPPAHSRPLRLLHRACCDIVS